MTQQNAVLGGPTSRLLDRERIVARPGFNRWLVPPAALAVHLCIGMAYGFSVFWLPLSRAIGITEPKTCPDLTLLSALFTTTCDWRISDLVWMYTLFFVFLGASAALFGGWLERAGPRNAGVVAAICWCGGMAVSALGVYSHQLWLMWLGSGVIGGIGLGLGYISPVSTLIKWFPDRRGMATGMAIMGFGGGAMIGSPLANILMSHFQSPTSVGVWPTFLILAALYFLFMMAGSLGYRVPPQNWRPDGWTPPATTGTRMIAAGNVALPDAHKTLQFWLLWAMLCLNVSASIGIIGVAAPMIQELFGGALFGEPGVPFTALDATQRSAAAAVAAGFVGLISLFNIGGRFFWASLSDRLGRKATYAVFFALGAALYFIAPMLAASHSLFLFVAAFCIIASMYGGGFATIPAYLADIFGTQFVGAIHGRLLTAWSTAGVLGPLIVAYLRDAQIAAGVDRAHVYDTIMHVLAGLLVAGFASNLFVRPLTARWFMKEADAPTVLTASAAPASGDRGGIGKGGLTPATTLAWIAIGLPIAWGIWITLAKALVLFR